MDIIVTDGWISSVSGKTRHFAEKLINVCETCRNILRQPERERKGGRQDRDGERGRERVALGFCSDVHLGNCSFHLDRLLYSQYSLASYSGTQSDTYICSRCRGTLQSLSRRQKSKPALSRFSTSILSLFPTPLSFFLFRRNASNI